MQTTVKRWFTDKGYGFLHNGGDVPDIMGSWGFSVLKRHNPLQPPWLLASSGVLTSS